MNEIDEMDLLMDKFFESCHDFAKEHIPEEDLDMEWEEFHKKHPLIQEHEFWEEVKKTQEM